MNNKLEYTINIDSFFEKLSIINDEISSDERIIRMLIEKAYELNLDKNSSLIIDDEFLSKITENSIEKAIEMIENSDNHNFFWNDVIEIDYFKDNLNSLENELFDDEWGLF